MLDERPNGSTAAVPAVLARVPYGAGEYVFCQVQPKRFYGNWSESKITRLLSAILGEKGIADALDMDPTVEGYQRNGYPYFGATLYFDPFLSTAW